VRKIASPKVTPQRERSRMGEKPANAEDVEPTLCPASPAQTCDLMCPQALPTCNADECIMREDGCCKLTCVPKKHGTKTQGQTVDCALDVHKCQDGSYVSRDPKIGCRFPPCLKVLSECEACLQSGGSWQPATKQCTKNCDIHGFSCYRDKCPKDPEFCADSPLQTCKKMCDPAVLPNCSVDECVMREGSCCEFTCASVPKATGNALSVALRSDLLGDALEPTYKGEGVKHEEHTRGHKALLFFFGAIMIGCSMLVLQEHYVHAIPYTSMVFVAGLIIAFIHHMNESLMAWSSWYQSIELWENINPHLLVYVFLPALVFAEAMRLNVHLLKNTMWQIMILACPGVLLGSAAVGAFGYFVLPYNWGLSICLILGAILSATDPVAVTAVFGTLGVSPVLTMVISGESLLNDGTALVVFTLMLKVALGAQVDVFGVAVFFSSMTVGAVVLGFLVATLCLVVISWSALERGHSDAVIQVAVTIACGYLCFFFAESEVSTSGVLTVVCAGTVFAHYAWPKFVSRQVVLSVWETIEFVGNTIIFILAGMLFGEAWLSRRQFISLVDVLWLLLTYVALTFIRAVIVFFFLPVLSLVGRPLAWEEGVVIVWAGLRGAVSLAMAIIVDTEPEISKKMGTRIIFHVGGVAMLTLLVNATTISKLLSALGLTQTSSERKKMLEHLSSTINASAGEAFQKAMVDGGSDVRFEGADEDLVRSLVPALNQQATSTGFQNDDEATGAGGWQHDDLGAPVCRTVLLQLVQRHYQESIDAGIVPRTSEVARILLNSKDEALEYVDTSLNDWEAIAQAIQTSTPTRLGLLIAMLAEHRPIRWVPGMHRAFATPEVVAAWKVYAALSFQEAHRCAQVELPQYLGAEECGDNSSLIKVLAESAEQCAEAAEMVATLPAESVRLCKSRMLAHRLLRRQVERVRFLERSGLVSAAEAHKLGRESHDALWSIAKDPGIYRL